MEPQRRERNNLSAMGMMIKLRTQAWRAVADAVLVAASALVSSGQSTQAEIQPAGEVLREIVDPSTGDRWLLMPGRPGGPGRLALAGQTENRQGRADRSEAKLVAAPGLPVIHAGDALIVEEHTPVVDARLEAVALNPAVCGASLQARLKIGGNIVRVRAVAPGRAMIAPASEGER